MRAEIYGDVHIAFFLHPCAGAFRAPLFVISLPDHMTNNGGAQNTDWLKTSTFPSFDGGQFEHFVGRLGHFRTVRHNDDATVLVMRQHTEDAHDVVLRGRIEIAGRLVREGP